MSSDVNQGAPPVVVRGPSLIDSETLAGPEWLNLRSARTLDQWAYRGVGPPYVRVGKHRRYRPADVEHWLDEQTRSGHAAV
jgi:hypothetical protein